MIYFASIESGVPDTDVVGLVNALEEEGFAPTSVIMGDKRVVTGTSNVGNLTGRFSRLVNATVGMRASIYTRLWTSERKQ